MTTTTPFNAAPATDHLEPLYALNNAATFYLAGMLGSHFVSHDSLTRDDLMRMILAAEADTK